jgi:circadian clock protein KaiB
MGPLATSRSFSFRLYVAGRTERSQAAVANLRFLCEAHLTSQYDVEIIDATERPDLAEEGRILATPTVVRLAPLPQRRVIGDLSDHVRAAAALGLSDPDGLPSERR